jgi:hypothetical protein
VQFVITAQHWVTLVPPPFAVRGIAGDNRQGVIVFNGTQVAYNNNYAANEWHLLAPPPFAVQGIAGDNGRGVIVYHENNFAYNNRVVPQ